MPGRQESAGRGSGSFDAFDVARRGASLAGTVDAAALPRAADRLAEVGDAAKVSWRIAGTADALGRPALEVSLDGTVPLVCQRCLQPFSWPVAQRTLLLLARDERELAILDAEDEHEVVPAATRLDTVTLVEDELLLTLPFAPRCERATCAAASSVAGDAAEAPAASAFAALAGLKTGSRKKAKKAER
jgi:uncharacterized protein